MSMEVGILGFIYLAALLAAYFLGRAGMHDLPGQENKLQAKKHTALGSGELRRASAANDDSGPLDQAN